MKVEVRAAHSGDVPGMARIAAAALPERWSASQLASSLRAAATVALIAEVPDAARPCAYALAQRVLEELQIVSIAVEPARQRHGVGRHLLAALLDAERARGARRATLEVRESNAAARALYAGFGFAIEGRRPRYYADGEDAVLLGASL